eukprot:CAMPEP_0118915490 /NCGR_PEP_ID=MMETSP1166-20130328/15642_1 /TAXON_ID=1104430 /ORGANISM="Chrysoreinhardia sp, Strain CCMP3193" /LENGTH=280 /DNA_ID=CAMNT_0006855189 /DNA_START=17 /DNA_END=859 /DNA_ORIENTATION=+
MSYGPKALEYHTLAELKAYAAGRGVDLKGAKLKREVVALLEKVAPIPTALELHPEWSTEQKALYEHLRGHFDAKQTGLVRRRDVKEKLLFKASQLDAMPFEAVWHGRWRASVGHWLCYVREALEAGVQEWKSLDAFQAAKKKKEPPTLAEIRDKLAKKKSSLKRKIDAAFKTHNKTPLDDVDAYSDLPHATLRVRQPITDRRRVLWKKANRCEQKYGDRRLAYESAGDTSESCYVDTFEQNVVDAYLQGHKNLVYKTMDGIASYLADPSGVEPISDREAD